jgi:hypothetical protein
MEERHPLMPFIVTNEIYTVKPRFMLTGETDVDLAPG